MSQIMRSDNIKNPKLNRLSCTAASTAVAKQLGINPSYVSRVARGERESAKVEAALLREIQRIEKLHNDSSSAVYLLLKFTTSVRFLLLTCFPRVATALHSCYGNQVYLLSMRPRRSALRLREILHSVPGIERGQIVRRRRILLPRLPRGLRPSGPVFAVANLNL